MANVRVIDKGWKKYVKDMGKIDGSFVKVGLPEGFTPGTPTKPDGEIRDASEILIIGATHEFGTDSAGKNRNVVIPERSYLRSTFDENKGRFSKVIEKAYSSVLTGRVTVATALGRVGLFAANRTKKKIRDLRTPELKVSPRKKRGGSNPLVDTGQLVQSITHEVKVRF